VPDLNFIILGITVAVFPHVCEIMSSNWMGTNISVPAIDAWCASVSDSVCCNQ
jgi:hypothetical protein